MFYNECLMNYISTASFNPDCRTKKAQIPGSVFGQVVGKNSCNLNAVKQGTNTQIEIDKVSKQSATRTLTIRLACMYIQRTMYMMLLVTGPTNCKICGVFGFSTTSITLGEQQCLVKIVGCLL